MTSLSQLATRLVQARVRVGQSRIHPEVELGDPFGVGE
jgi:hypothetical protein